MAYNTQVAWNSAGMPIGTRKIYLYVQNSPGINPATGLAGAPAFTNGQAAAGQAVAGCTLIGQVIMEAFNWKSGTKMIERMDNIGADLDFALLRQRVTASGTLQLSNQTSALLLAGVCFCEVSPGFEQDNLTPLPYVRLVFSEITKDESEGNAQKLSVSIVMDRNNSDAYWSL